MKKYGVEVSFVINDIKSPSAQQVVRNVMNKLSVSGHCITNLHVQAFIEDSIIPIEDEKYFVTTDKDKEEIVDRMAEDVIRHEDLRIKNGAPEPDEQHEDQGFHTEEMEEEWLENNP